MRTGIVNRQSTLLKNATYTINFNTSSLNEAMSDISRVYQQLYDNHQGNVGLIGCSSGGFLGLNVLKYVKKPLFTLLICPVLDPENREYFISSQMKEQQLLFFKEKPYLYSSKYQCYCSK